MTHKRARGDLREIPQFGDQRQEGLLRVSQPWHQGRWGPENSAVGLVSCLLAPAHWIPADPPPCLHRHCAARPRAPSACIWFPDKNANVTGTQNKQRKLTVQTHVVSCVYPGHATTLLGARFPHAGQSVLSSVSRVRRRGSPAPHPPGPLLPKGKDVQKVEPRERLAGTPWPCLPCSPAPFLLGDERPRP